jgi:hypothetical protein
MTRLIPAELARQLGVHKSTVSRKLRAFPHLIDAMGRVDMVAYLAAVPSGDGEVPAPAEALKLTQARARVCAARAELAAAEAWLASLEAEANDVRAAVLAVPGRYLPDSAEAEACRLELARALAPLIGGADG